MVLPSASYIDEGVGGSKDVEEYFQFAISPDCSTCDLDSNVANNPYAMFNDDTSSERTAYYMTGTLFGCLAYHKAQKDCRWDYDTYTCNYCTNEVEDLDLSYHIISPDRSDDWDYWTEFAK